MLINNEFFDKVAAMLEENESSKNRKHCLLNSKTKKPDNVWLF